MKQQTRERALRAMTAALLSSDLTPGEIREVARSFKTDSSLAEQLAHLVDTIVANLHVSSGEPKRIAPKRAEEATPELDHFLQALDSSNLSREDLVRRLQSYAQNPEWNPKPDWAPRKILGEFIKIAPTSSLKPALLAVVAGPVKPDPYVDLILAQGKASNG